MSFLTKRPSRRATVAGAVVLAAGMFIGYAGAPFAGQGGLPADKTAIAGSSLQDFEPNTEHTILETTMAVSSTTDLILGVTLECSILTRLVTDNDHETATSTGSVDVYLKVDGKRVPVQTVPTRDDGSVTFCNRTYQRTEKDDEDPLDGIDTEDDYIRTKAANSFNWVALNVGTVDYDTLGNGNNVVRVEVVARYDRTHAPATCVTATGVNSCSEAYVGKRTLVVEPVKAARGEQSEPTGISSSH